MDSVQVAIIILFGILGFLILCGTGFDLLPCRDEDQLTKDALINRTFRGGVNAFLLSFSVTTNARNLCDTTVKVDTLPFIHGIRVLSMSWIVLINVYELLTPQCFSGEIDKFNKLPRYPFLESIARGYVVADTFFFIGGFLIAFRSFKGMERNGNILNIFRFYFHRMLRILPPILAAVGFLFLVPLMGSGSTWNKVANWQMEKCKTYWWGPVFLVNSWLKFDKTCLPQSWYMSVDFHFVLLSPLVIVPLYRWPVVGVATVLSFVAASSTATGLRSYFYHTHYHSAINQTSVMDLYKSEDLFIRPYPHFGVYCIGMLVGYVIVKHPKFKVHILLQLFGWCAAVFLSTVILMKPNRWVLSELPTATVAALYSSLHHVGWAIVMSWVVLMCATGRGGIITCLLSWKMFIPIGRLMYAVYLISYSYLWYLSHLNGGMSYSDHFSLVNQFFATLSICLLMGFFFYLFFEAPMGPLEKVLLPKERNSYGRLSKEQTPRGLPTKSNEIPMKDINADKV